MSSVAPNTWYIYTKWSWNLHKTVKRRRPHSHARRQEHLGWRVFFSGPSRGCDAIRKFKFRWLLMERTRKRSAPVDESHRQWPFPRGLRWAVLYYPSLPVVGWDLKSCQKTVLLKALLCLLSLSLLLNYSLFTSQIACLHKRRCYK